jgi:hypothetical protein
MAVNGFYAEPLALGTPSRGTIHAEPNLAASYHDAPPVSKETVGILGEDGLSDAGRDDLVVPNYKVACPADDDVSSAVIHSEGILYQASDGQRVTGANGRLEFNKKADHLAVAIDAGHREALCGQRSCDGHGGCKRKCDKTRYVHGCGAA